MLAEEPTATLSDPTATKDDLFGNSVAVSGKTAVVGAVYADLAQRLRTPTWRLHRAGRRRPTTTFRDPKTTEGDDFGGSVEVSGKPPVVGANGTSLDEGTVYIYKT